MKAAELRIGNWVMYSSKIQVNENKIRECVDHPDRFVPITITEEWLQRFGFEKVSGDYVRYDLKASEDIYIVYADDFSCGLFNSKESEEDELGVIPNWETIKHVHQLQNLYFTLTGQEITIKE